MYLIIIGAGPLGVSLTALALDDGHDVALIEEDDALAQAAAQRFDCTVLHATVAKGGVLEEAKVDKADAVVATTADDSANLMAMFLGVEHSVGNLVSVVNEPNHTGLFERLGVHTLLDPEIIIAKYLYGLVCQPSLTDLVPLPDGATVFEIEVGSASALAGKSLMAIGKQRLLPKDTLVVMVKRGETAMVPSGKTQLEAGDHLTIFTQGHVDEGALKVFKG